LVQAYLFDRAPTTLYARDQKYDQLASWDGHEGKSAMARRGVIYMVWGRDDKVERALERSRKSVNAIHPELPVEVIRVDAAEGAKGLLEKARMLERSPFRETLFLDADTVVLDRLDFAFHKAEEFGIACCICENPWAKRYNSAIKGETVEYNTGVLFFTARARPVFQSWVRLAPQLDSSIVHLSATGQPLVMSHNDQCSFAAAIEKTKFLPFVLPINWNFRPQWHLSFFGPVKVWHDYGEVPHFLVEAAKYYRQPQSIIQYHAAR
jgi:hypothetical protein